MSVLFTEAEVVHAQNVVDKLLRERRFFINTKPKHVYTDFSYNFDKEIFDAAMSLQQKLTDSYARVKANAEKKIRKEELALGFNPALIENNQSVVQCNRYGAGFDIKSVFPLSYFINSAPIDSEKVYKNLLAEEMGKKTFDDYSPNQMRIIEERMRARATTIVAQFTTMSKKADYSNMSVVLFESNFNLKGYPDLACKQFDDIEKYPELLAYLYYEKSKSSRLVPDDYILFNTMEIKHVLVRHKYRGTPTINYEKNGGYNCLVHFSTIM